MDDKSHVSMEQRACLVCAQAFDTGGILLDTRVRPSLAPHTVTGWGLCPEHQRLSDEGFIALVECDPQRSGTPAARDVLTPSQAHRTGRVAHMKRDAFTKVFGATGAEALPCVFIEPGVIEKLLSMVQPAAD